MRLIKEIMSVEDILKTVEQTGFSYDPEQDIFFSVMDPWQRKFGYCWLYDEACAPLSLIVDCEPVRFRYGGKKWLIELWKGQYGMTTGAEIGVYNTTGPDLDIPGVFNGTFYYCAEDKDHLRIFYALRKGNRILFTRQGKHWWLTGFHLGQFSDPEELTLEARITLKDKDMCRAFAGELARLGYRDDEVRVKDKTVWITFSKPYSEQPSTRTKLTVSVSQNRNRFLCEKYTELTSGARTLAEKLNILQRENPELLDIAINFGKPKAVYEKYDLLKKYL